MLEQKLDQIHQMMDFIPELYEVKCDYSKCDDYPILNKWAKARDDSFLYYNRKTEGVVFIAQSYNGHNGDSYDRVGAEMSIYAITSAMMDMIYNRMIELVKAQTAQIRHQEQQQSKTEQNKKILDNAGLSFIHP